MNTTKIAKSSGALFLVFLYVASFLLLALTQLVPTPKALAAVTEATKAEIDAMKFEWTDPRTVRATLKEQVITFNAVDNVATGFGGKDANTLIANEYTCGSSQDSASNAKILAAFQANPITQGSQAGRSNNELVIRYKTEQGCKDYTRNISISNANLREASIGWVDSGNIRVFKPLRGIGVDEIFKKDTDGRFYRTDESGECRDVIIVNGNRANVIELKDGADQAPANQISVAGLSDRCEVLSVNGQEVSSVEDANRFIGSSLPLSGLVNKERAPGSGLSEESPTEAQPDCDMTADSPLSWIICPLVDLGANFSDYAFTEIIKPLLADVPVSTDPSDGSYIAWQQFRILGNVVLVGAMLAVVYAQIKGS